MCIGECSLVTQTRHIHLSLNCCYTQTQNNHSRTHLHSEPIEVVCFRHVRKNTKVLVGFRLLNCHINTIVSTCCMYIHGRRRDNKSVYSIDTCFVASARIIQKNRDAPAIGLLFALQRHTV